MESKNSIDWLIPFAGRGSGEGGNAGLKSNDSQTHCSYYMCPIYLSLVVVRGGRPEMEVVLKPLSFS